MTLNLSQLNSCTVKVQLIRNQLDCEFDYFCRTPGDVDRLVGEELRQQDREHFLVIYLNCKNKVIGIEVVAIGSLSDTIITPREVFKGAILANACAIILVHNHPSGSIIPGRDDQEITRNLARVGAIHNIPVRDHVIIGTGFYSFCQAGLLPYDYN